MSMITTNKLQRIPLSERLKTENGTVADYLRIPVIFIDDYLIALGRINGKDYSALMNEIENMYGLIPYMASFVTEAGVLDMPEEDRVSLLYQLLIEPFAEIENFDLERGRKNDE